MLRSIAYTNAFILLICLAHGRCLARESPQTSKPNTKETAPESPKKPTEQPTEQEAEPKRELYRGTVLWAQDALKKRGIKVADEMKNQAVLVCKNGEIIPIAADWRGRSFFQDEKLRNREVELVGYRRPRLPYLQVLIVYTFNSKGVREETDYWCDVCSIPMYEIKECECCQGPIRLRFRATPLPNYLSPSKLDPVIETKPKTPAKSAE